MEENDTLCIVVEQDSGSGAAAAHIQVQEVEAEGPSDMEVERVGQVEKFEGVLIARAEEGSPIFLGRTGSLSQRLGNQP